MNLTESAKLIDAATRVLNLHKVTTAIRCECGKCVLCYQNARNKDAVILAHSILATVHTDDDLPADAAWFAGLPGAEWNLAIERYVIRGGLAYLSFGTSQHIEPPISRAWFKSSDFGSEASLRDPTRSQVRHACLSMGWALNEGGEGK